MSFEKLRTLLEAQTYARDGSHHTALPELLIHRRATPSPSRDVKATGMRLGALVRGEKIVRVEGHELLYTPGTFLVITEASDFTSELLEAPYLALGDDVAKHVSMSASHFAHRSVRSRERVPSSI